MYDDVENVIKEFFSPNINFAENLQVGDICIVEFGKEYKQATVTRETYSAETGCRYLDVDIKGKPYAVPAYVVYPFDRSKIINKAYIYSKSQRGIYFSGRSLYELVYEGQTIKTVSCLGRKDANNRLITDIDLINKYDIDRIYSNGDLIYKRC